jgi:hypothetical protein
MSAFGPARAESSLNQTHVLLIGEWDYSAAKLPDLDGPRNDIALMRDLLHARFGVPDSAIVMLSNPTHTQVQHAFEDLQKQVSPGDLVYIQFSGHGSTTPDPGDPRGEDQTWVPHGARVEGVAGLDSMDILDKEIALWLKPLYDKTQDVVFVSDSCHSATVSRGESRRGVRQVDPAIGAMHPLVGTLAKVPYPTSGVRIGAARDFESAVELEPTSGRACAAGSSTCYGVFTWNWAQALRESEPGASWGDVFRRTAARVSAVPSTYQRPQLDGQPGRAVLQARFASVMRSVEVSSVDDGGALLNAGWLVGVTAGSTYEVKPAAAAASAAVLAIDHVDGSASHASVVSGHVRAGDLAVERSHAVTTPAIRLFVGADDQDAEGSRKLADALAHATDQLGAYELVSDRQSAELRLLPARAVKTEWQVQTAQGLIVDPRMRFDLKRDEELQRLLDDLEAFAWARQIRALGERGNPTALTLQVKSAILPAGQPVACEDSQNVGGRWKRSQAAPFDNLETTRTLGECLSFEIANRDQARSLYGYVIAIGPDFRVQSIWPGPQENADAARVAPQGKVSPDNFYYLGDAGRETLLFLSSDRAIDPVLLQHNGVRGEARSPLEAALAAAAGRRGSVQRIGQWGATGVDLQVVAAKGGKP